jgi:hypothetical protein
MELNVCSYIIYVVDFFFFKDFLSNLAITIIIRHYDKKAPKSAGCIFSYVNRMIKTGKPSYLDQTDFYGFHFKRAFINVLNGKELQMKYDFTHKRKGNIKKKNL